MTSSGVFFFGQPSETPPERYSRCHRSDPASTAFDTVPNQSTLVLSGTPRPHATETTTPSGKRARTEGTPSGETVVRSACEKNCCASRGSRERGRLLGDHCERFCVERAVARASEIRELRPRLDAFCAESASVVAAQESRLSALESRAMSITAYASPLVRVSIRAAVLEAMASVDESTRTLYLSPTHCSACLRSNVLRPPHRRQRHLRPARAHHLLAHAH